jgi:hypothetical protein
MNKLVLKYEGQETANRLLKGNIDNNRKAFQASRTEMSAPTEREAKSTDLKEMSTGVKQPMKKEWNILKLSKATSFDATIDVFKKNLENFKLTKKGLFPELRTEILRDINYVRLEKEFKVTAGKEYRELKERAALDDERDGRLGKVIQENIKRRANDLIRNGGQPEPKKKLKKKVKRDNRTFEDLRNEALLNLFTIGSNKITSTICETSKRSMPSINLSESNKGSFAGLPDKRSSVAELKPSSKAALASPSETNRYQSDPNIYWRDYIKEGKPGHFTDKLSNLQVMIETYGKKHTKSDRRLVLKANRIGKEFQQMGVKILEAEKYPKIHVPLKQFKELVTQNHEDKMQRANIERIGRKSLNARILNAIT